MTDYKHPDLQRIMLSFKSVSDHYLDSTVDVLRFRIPQNLTFSSTCSMPNPNFWALDSTLNRLHALHPATEISNRKPETRLQGNDVSKIRPRHRRSATILSQIAASASQPHKPLSRSTLRPSNPSARPPYTHPTPQPVPFSFLPLKPKGTTCENHLHCYAPKP